MKGNSSCGLEQHSYIDLGIDEGIGKNVIYFPSVDSTNRFLKENTGGLPDGTVVWAGRQTAGRGRDGRSWVSPPGGLYFSILLLDPPCRDEIQLISLMTALAVKKAVMSSGDFAHDSPHQIDIKWPNDILISGMKIAGILAEAVSGGGKMRLVAGIGVNVKTVMGDFPPELAGTASSIIQFHPGGWDLKNLLRGILTEFDSRLSSFNPAKLVDEYRSECRFWGKKCRAQIPSGTISGVCKDITRRGELLIDTEYGEVKIITGTIIVDW